MKPLIWLLLVVVGAVAVPLVIGHGNGYVLLVQPPYRIELSTSLFLLLTVLVLLTAHGLLHLINYTLRLPAKVRAFKQAQREKNAHAALMESLSALAAGRYGRAEKAAALALELGANPLIAALTAARAAHKMKNYERRDYYLAEAEQRAPDEAVARLLCQAELLLDQRRFADALEALKHLAKRDAKHLPAMQLELKARRQLADWEGTLALISQLEKRGGIEELTAQQWKLQAYQELLGRLAGDADLLRTYWHKVPDHDQLDARIALVAAKRFVQAGDGETAATIIERSLTKRWESPLAAYYGECVGNLSKQLEQAEYWLRIHHQDAGLLLSLGKLCRRQGLWGKAQSYLEASLSLQDSSDAHFELAQILEKLGHPQAAAEHYRLSLERKMEECA
ncbi:MAG: heme biosynthesis protein HemY [Methylophilaceae bacterium]|nr:heme biosynthesis protein HemY [Methylophilaceae bacterium]